MPIVYETEAPVAAAASIYDRLARHRQLVGEGYGGGGGGGGGGRGYQYGNVPYDTGIQDAIQARDQMQFAQQRQAQNTQAGYDQQRMQTEGAMAQDAQRFQLQAQLHDVELSQQERMRLQRLKNSIGEVQNDPTLTEEEKNDFTSQLKYNIDPLQRRLAQEKLSQEKMVKESMAEQKQAQAALEKQRQDIMAKSVADRVSFIPDATQLAKIAEDYTKNVGPHLTALYGPDAAQKIIGQMAQQEALKQGLGSHAYLQPDGKLTPMHGEVGASGELDKSGKGSKGDGGVDHPSGLGPQDYMKAREHAIGQLQREQAMTKENEFGQKQPRYPELDTPEGYQKRLKELMGGLPADYSEYNAAKPAQKTKGYQSRFAAPDTGKGPQTPADASQKPFDFADAKSQTPEQQGQVQQFASVGKEIMGAKASFEERQAAAAALGEAQSLLMKSGSVGNMNADQKRKYVAAMNTVAGVLKGGQHTPAAAAASSPAGDGRPWWEQLRKGEYDPTGAGKYIDFRTMNGDNFKRGLGVIGDALTPNLGKIAEGLGQATETVRGK